MFTRLKKLHKFFMDCCPYNFIPPLVPTLDLSHIAEPTWKMTDFTPKPRIVRHKLTTRTIHKLGDRLMGQIRKWECDVAGCGYTGESEGYNPPAGWLQIEVDHKSTEGKVKSGLICYCEACVTDGGVVSLKDIRDACK